MLLIPFARTQSKSLVGQYQSGSRFFDLRVKQVDGKLYLAHGLWVSKTSLTDALIMLNNCAEGAFSKPIISITYEGSLSSGAREKFAENIIRIMHVYKNLHLGSVAVKKPVWKTLYAHECPRTKKGFYEISGWRCVLPIPFLWHLLDYDQSEPDVITLVDFI